MKDWDAIIALGSNIGDKVANVESARELLCSSPANEVSIVAASRIYKTPPWGITDQDWFVNACMSVKTSLGPHELLRRCLAVEQVMGRRRAEKWGPRLIDLDVLVYRGVEVADDELVLPHPHITERAFVLIPMREVAPDLVLKGRSVGEWAEAIDATGVEPIEPQA